MERAEFLRKASLFSSLSRRELACVAEQFYEKRFTKDEYIFFEGDPAEVLYVVQAGRVKMIKHSEGGQDVILRVVAPGEMLGGVAAFGEETYPATAQAQEAVSVLAMSGETFMALVRRYPALALAVIQLLKERVKEAHEVIRQLAVERVERRIAHTLIRLADKVGVAGEEGIVIDMPLPRQDLADMAGTSLETVSRVLSKWQRQGLVKAGRERVIITHAHGLVAIAEDLPPGAERPPSREAHVSE
ncbi:MAG: Crp/Fnr family transcriptional regulator [Anaerolineae bacterium]